MGVSRGEGGGAAVCVRMKLRRMNYLGKYLWNPVEPGESSHYEAGQYTETSCSFVTLTIHTHIHTHTHTHTQNMDIKLKNSLLGRETGTLSPGDIFSENVNPWWGGAADGRARRRVGTLRPYRSAAATEMHRRDDTSAKKGNDW